MRIIIILAVFIALIHTNNNNLYYENICQEKVVLCIKICTMHTRHCSSYAHANGSVIYITFNNMMLLIQTYTLLIELLQNYKRLVHFVIIIKWMSIIRSALPSLHCGSQADGYTVCKITLMRLNQYALVKSKSLCSWYVSW